MTHGLEIGLLLLADLGEDSISCVSFLFFASISRSNPVGLKQAEMWHWVKAKQVKKKKKKKLTRCHGRGCTPPHRP